MSRREARIAREFAKELNRIEKSTRLRERIPDSGARLGAEPDTGREARVGADPKSIFAMRVTWDRDAADVKGEWSWGVSRQWSDDEWENLIAQKLEQWGNLTWGEIDRFSSDTGHKMHHNMDTNVICDEAQSRLSEIECYSDTVFRFRLGNKRRLWGLRTVAHFEILWFDPTHKVYPTEPD